VILLIGSVAEIAESHALRHEAGPRFLRRPRGVTEGAGPLVAGVRRSALQLFPMALAAKALSLREELRLLRPGRAPESPWTRPRA
jgi:hypothetical protein